MFTVTKKTASNWHSRQRMAERHGLVLTKKARKAIIDDIRNQKAKFLGRQSNRVTGWEVEFEGKQIKVLYDSKRGCLITVLPEGAVWPYEEQADEYATAS